MSARAELLADAGAAAAGEDFFRCPEFLAAEGVTHTLRIEVADGANSIGETGGASGPGELLAPLIVRQIGDGPELDAISPYGYPGFERGRPFRRIPKERTTAPGGLVDPPSLDPAQIDFSATGLVSVFLRHRLDLVPLAAATERNTVQIADPALPAKSRPSDRRQIRRNLEAGYALSLVPGPETSAPQRAGFLDLYEQTMRRTAAAAHYFFGAAYFDRILAADRTWLAHAHAPDGTLAAASLAVVSDGYLHYYLSGSADSHLAASPMKNVLARLVEHASELVLPLNLGGGLAPGDALEEFKRGFANRTESLRTSELVCDPERYAALSGDRPASGFFPAYRA